MTSRSFLHWVTYHMGSLPEALPRQFSVAGQELSFPKTANEAQPVSALMGYDYLL